ncbi:CYTH domain-containing protein [Saccharopolyspora spinosa]|uniref:Adenylate cyclase class 2 n=1 Tax=Saccharopolyspora spinosa TaxID=60894 RepID=A0A2N3Y748_SACSN|nr:CYTH domain-containing protein [Saccharopolyspora spinosa]PKW18730.1 adenylate cyclase class 2 [Saccharopolyspora spinosa]
MFQRERTHELTSGDGNALTERLAELQFHRLHRAFEADTYYSDGTRIRQRNGYAEITRTAAAAEHHHITGVTHLTAKVVLLSGDQAVAAHELLSALGLDYLVRVQKVRTVFQHVQETITVTVDELTDLQRCFAETKVTASTMTNARQRLAAAEHSLGLSHCRIEPRPYPELVLAHLAAHNSEPAKAGERPWTAVP